MNVKTGSRWRSAVCETEVVVVRCPAGEVRLECGGAPMLDIGETPSTGALPAEPHAQGTLLGKRYAALGLEVLCTKQGAGSLSVDGTQLAVKGAKPLPSSD